MFRQPAITIIFSTCRTLHGVDSQIQHVADVFREVIPSTESGPGKFWGKREREGEREREREKAKPSAS
jgi:hypothetical protein